MIIIADFLKITDLHWSQMFNCSPMQSLSPVNLLRSKRIESATHPTISWVCFENRGAVHLWSKLFEKLLVRNIWKLIKSLHQLLSICIALLLISGPCSWMSNSCCFISSVRSSSGYHGLLHINPVFQILQILKWKWKWKDPTCAIFLKSMWFKDIEYDIPVYQM